MSDYEPHDSGLPGKPMAFIMLFSVLLVIVLAGYGLFSFVQYILSMASTV